MVCPKCNSLMSDVPDTPCVPCELAKLKRIQYAINRWRSRCMWSDRDTGAIIDVLDHVLEVIDCQHQNKEPDKEGYPVCIACGTSFARHTTVMGEGGPTVKEWENDDTNQQR